ncbi:MAG: glycosyltransferase family 4 protein [Armatimonadetes bacterium]|nr:glycosyltransferase family 4 protein [Armatimonadota bacterium]
MRILMIAARYHPHTGGVEKHLRCVCRDLLRHGHEVAVVTRKHRADLPGRELVEGVTVYRIPEEPLAGIAGTERIRPLLWFLAHSSLVRWADVIHGHDYGVIWSWYRPYRFLMPWKPLTVTFHGYEGYPVPPRAVARRRRVERLTRGNICVGDFIVKWYGTRADYVTYGGVDVARYASAGPPCGELPLRIAYLGRYEPDTGVGELVEAAAAHQRASGRRVSLHLFGQGSLEAALRERSAAEGIPESVSPPVEDTAAVLARFPVLFASGYLTILEGLCAGRIVFGYYANPLREDYLRLHPAAKSLVICGGAADVVRGLARCDEDLPGACRASEPGWEWARQQTWDAVARLYLRLWGAPA